MIKTSPNATGEIRHWLAAKFPILLQSGECLVGGLCLDVAENEPCSRELFQLNLLAIWIYARERTQEEFLADLTLADVVRGDRAGKLLDVEALCSLDADHEISRTWWHITK